MKRAGHVACMGAEREVYKVSAGKSEEKRPLGNQVIDGGWDQN
jgi:hypothetical protein